MTATTSKLGADMTDALLYKLWALALDTTESEFKQKAPALLARQPAAIDKQAAVAWEMDWPEYSYDGMGCGLEDRNITDRYDAMKYGWDEAMERVGQILERDGPLYAAPLDTGDCKP